MQVMFSRLLPSSAGVPGRQRSNCSRVQYRPIDRRSASRAYMHDCPSDTMKDFLYCCRLPHERSVPVTCSVCVCVVLDLHIHEQCFLSAYI